jgi:hypothetical protein
MCDVLILQRALNGLFPLLRHLRLLASCNRRVGSSAAVCTVMWPVVSMSAAVQQKMQAMAKLQLEISQTPAPTDCLLCARALASMGRCKRSCARYREFQYTPNGLLPLACSPPLLRTSTLPLRQPRGGHCTSASAFAPTTSTCQKTDESCPKGVQRSSRNPAPTNHFPYARASASMLGTQDRAGATEQFTTCPMAKLLSLGAHHSLSPKLCRASTCVAATHCHKSSCFDVNICPRKKGNGQTDV